jgi:ABC-type multidrug transport system fused ATPase/permease subunit
LLHYLLGRSRYRGRRRLRGASPLVAELLELWPVVADRRLIFAVLVALGLASSILEALAVTLVSVLLYLAVGGGQGRPFAALRLLIGIDPIVFLHQNFRIACATVAIIILLRVVVVAAYGVTATSVKSLMFHRLRERLYRRHMFGQYEAISQESFGFLINTLQIEAPRVAELVDQLLRMPINGSAAIVFFGLFFALSWRVASLTVGVGIGVAVFVQLSRGFLHRLGQRAMVLHEQLASRMLSGIQALRTIRAFGAERREFDRVVEASRFAAGILVRFAVVENLVAAVANLTVMGLIALVILCSVMLGDAPTTTLTMVALLYRLQPQMTALQSSLTSIYALQSSLHLIVGLLGERDNAPMPSTADIAPPEPVRFRRAIRFRDVSYRYPGTSEATLHHLNFEISCGLVTAIVGPSGAGKTTILNLLLRLTEPSEGVIEVDGVPLSSIDRGQWLRSIAISGQDVDVMTGTVLDNLRLGSPALSRKEAWDALELAGVAELVHAFPAGLETQIGERGYRLSGGQRQRVALARAIAMRPTILILDEATNAVDALLEAEIHQRVRARFPNLTILIVAHRGSAFSGVGALIEIVEGRVSGQCPGAPMTA